MFILDLFFSHFLPASFLTTHPFTLFKRTNLSSFTHLIYYNILKNIHTYHHPRILQLLQSSARQKHPALRCATSFRTAFPAAVEPTSRSLEPATVLHHGQQSNVLKNSAFRSVHTHKSAQLEHVGAVKPIKMVFHLSREKQGDLESTRPLWRGSLKHLR